MKLGGKVAWVTGGGSGIGEAAAIALADEGATVFVSGRRAERLDLVVAAIRRMGATSHALPGDLSLPTTASSLVEAILGAAGRLDVLVNNAGTNIPDRSWAALTTLNAAGMLEANLHSAFFAVIAALPVMRRQGDGVIINTASVAGRVVSAQPGSSYVAAKHGVVAMSHSINMEECQHGIRSTALCPGEVATPIVDSRPVPVSAEDRARMVQAGDVGDLIRYIATLPPRVCINEVFITPTWNRAYLSAAAAL